MPERWPGPACRAGATLCCALLLSACVGFAPQPGQGPEPKPLAHCVDLTLPFVDVGDTQEHESAGYPLHCLRSIDVVLVRQQRAARGSLVEWVREAFSTDCEFCELTRDTHAQAYQNEWLATLLEVGLQIGPEACELTAVPLPPWCAGDSDVTCSDRVWTTWPTRARRRT